MARRDSNDQDSVPVEMTSSSEAREESYEDASSKDCRRAKLRKLLKEFFREELPEGLSPRRSVDHAIETGEASPVNRNAPTSPKMVFEGENSR